MAFAPCKNGINRHVVWTATANATIALTDAIAVDANTDNVSALNITKVMWNGPWTIKRNTTLVWQTDANMPGVHDFTGVMGAALNANNDQSIVLTTTSANAFIMIECNKVTFANGSPVV